MAYVVGRLIESREGNQIWFLKCPARKAHIEPVSIINTDPSERKHPRPPFASSRRGACPPGGPLPSGSHKTQKEWGTSRTPSRTSTAAVILAMHIQTNRLRMTWSAFLPTSCPTRRASRTTTRAASTWGRPGWRSLCGTSPLFERSARILGRLRKSRAGVSYIILITLSSLILIYYDRSSWRIGMKWRSGFSD